jgi:hypothetical protein
MTTRPVAIGFTEGMTPIEELLMRVEAGHHDFAIMLAGGLALSRKRISYAETSGPGAPGIWHIENDIDGTTQMLVEAGLWESSNIGEALDKHALLDMSGDPILNLPDGPVLGSVLNAEAIAKAKAWREEQARERAEDPLTFRLSDGPGAIRMGEDADVDWEPADPSLTLEVCDIGPATVAEINLAAVCMGFLDPAREGSEECRHAATTSIELTIEDIDLMVETLLAIKEDAITNRGFALRADGFWTNGLE